MARGKKKETTLTQEEKLAQALVPVEEQSYPLPGNWCWIRQSAICGLSDGEKCSGKSFPYWEVKTLRGLKGIQYATEGKFVSKGTKVILVDGENSGEVFDIPDDGFMGSTFKALSISASVNWDYLRFFIATQKELYRNNKKGSAIPHLNKDLFFNMPLPFAPFAEQQRIVDRIERLFAKLDEAYEKAQEVVDNYGIRKAAILHRAFTGELTAKWRAEQGLEMNSWKNMPVNQLCKPRAGYAFDSKKFTESGYQVIRMGNLYGGALDLLRNPVFISPDDLDEATLKRSLINDGDILITLTGTKYKRDYGYAVVVKNATNLLVNQRILCLTPYNGVVTNYILYYFQSDIFRDIFFSNETGGVNQGNVSSRFVESIEIAVPSYSEQIELVRILDSIFAKEQQAKEAAEAVLEKIDLLKKSILARAFRGELGTNDPTEESALELLKAIL